MTPTNEARPAETGGWVLDDMEQRATTLADANEGDPWELLGFFREKLRQSRVAYADARDAAIRYARKSATPTPEPMDLPTDAQVREAMQTAWDDFCDDAQAIPGDIYREGRKTFFRAGTWADHAAMHLRAALTPEPVDLGADAERGAKTRACCSCAEVAGEDPRCFKHGEGTMWRKENPDVCLMNDALHEAIASPKGVVPPSAEPFYSHRLAALMSPPASVDATIERIAAMADKAGLIAKYQGIAADAGVKGESVKRMFDAFARDVRTLSATPTHPDQELSTIEGESE